MERVEIASLYKATPADDTKVTVCGWAKTVRDQPEMRMVRSFPDNMDYIQALAASVRQHWKTNGQPGPSYRLIMSFHGIPTRSIKLGDPYRDECLTTGQLLAKELNLDETRYSICFQSRFGPAEWLQPYTSATLEQLGQQGLQRVDILCPGFPADCLETLEEIDQLNRETFVEAGGGDFHYVPWGNDSEGAVASLEEQARIALAGWV